VKTWFLLGLLAITIVGYMLWAADGHPASPPSLKPVEGRIRLVPREVLQLGEVHIDAPDFPPQPAMGGARGADRETVGNSGSDAEAFCVIRAISPGGLPVRGLPIWLEGGMTSEALGKTDEQGELRVARGAILGRGLVPDSPRYAKHVYEVGEDVEDSFELALIHSATLEGVVHLSDGSPAGSGVEVTAVEAAYDTHGALRMWMPLRSAKLTTTDEQGCFLLGQLVEGEPYALFAGAPGVATLEGTFAVAGSTEPLRLTAHYVMGALLEFVDREGNRPTALHLLDGLQKADRATWPRGRAVSSRSRAAALAGVSRKLAFSTNPRLILFSSNTLESGPVARYESSPLGFAAIVEDLHLEWLGGNIPLYEIALEGRDSGFGEVIVMLEHDGTPTSTIRAPEGTVPEATLHLRRMNPRFGDRDPKLGLRGIFDGPCRVGGIPHGDYLASVEFSVGSYRYPEYGNPGVPLSVGAQPANLRVTVTGLCSLEVRLRTRDGLPYRGPAVIDLGEGETQTSNRKEGGVTFTSGQGPTMFACAPYVFPHLRPNRYHILMLTPGTSERERLDTMLPSVLLDPGSDALVFVGVGP
jgi:hypothetical protein